MDNGTVRVGIVTFAHPPVYDTDKQREKEALDDFNRFAGIFDNKEFTLLNPLKDLRKDKESRTFGISNSPDLDFCLDYFNKNRPDCIFIYLCQWTRISLVSTLIQEAGVPVALLASTDDKWVGEVTATAVSGSVQEEPVNKYCILLERFRQDDVSQVLKWAKTMGAMRYMNEGRLLSWGGQYGADIPYTRGDQAFLERTFIREVITEQEICIIEKAKDILKNSPDKIENFLRWLKQRDVEIEFDGKMLTQDALDFQIAQYIAAKQRLKEMQDENIIGASIKCHFEISTDCVGCTECLIAGFLPFGVDDEGKKDIIPVACEGDINGLMSSVILGTLNKKVPPLFGDMIFYKRDYILLRNCGSASVYWAGRSNDPDKTLNKVKLLPNMHGNSGCAVYFDTPEGDSITFARLFRFNGRFYMYLGLGRVYEKKVENKLGITWPHTRIYFDSEHELIYKTSPCNHGCITEGDLIYEIETLCRYAGIEVVRCDKDSSMKDFLRKTRKV